MDEPAKVEFGFSYRELLSFVEAVLNLGERQSKGGKSARVADFENELSNILGWELDRVTRASELFVVCPRNRFENHRHRTIVVIPTLGTSRVACHPKARGRTRGGRVGNRNIYMAGMYLWGLCSTGRFESRTESIKAAMSEMQHREAEKFNNAVAELFATLPNDSEETSSACWRAEDSAREWPDIGGHRSLSS